MNTSRIARHHVLAFFLLFALWGVLVRQVWLEWSSNPQYEFGFLLPFLLCLLIYSRWDDRPLVRSVYPWFVYLLLPLSFGLIGLSVIWFSSPDWRAVYWVTGLYALGSTVVILYSLGGVGWVKHFTLPFLLLLTGIPWPTFFELEVTNTLMRLVVVVAVEFLSFLGIYARPVGNVIHLRDGLVGVEEACSGIQSLQFAIMSVWFLAELFRRSWGMRIVLFVVAVVFAIIVNVVRAVSLTMIHHHYGPEKVESLHDAVGYIASIVIFLILLFISRKKNDAQRHDVSKLELTTDARLCRSFALSIGLVVTSYFLPDLWFSFKGEGRENNFQAVHVNWSTVPGLKIKEIPEATEAILRYSVGERREWKAQDGKYWIGFFFEWTGKKVSSFASVHNPENCLPAAGWIKEESYPIRMLNVNGLQVPWQMFRFRSANKGESFFVFFAVWDDRAVGVDHISQDAMDRLQDAWKGIRITHRQSLEFILFGEKNPNQAWNRFSYWLSQLVVLEN